MNNRDDVWIQEGLAQIFQYKAIENINPDWDIVSLAFLFMG